MRWERFRLRAARTRPPPASATERALAAVRQVWEFSRGAATAQQAREKVAALRRGSEHAAWGARWRRRDGLDDASGVAAAGRSLVTVIREMDGFIEHFAARDDRPTPSTLAATQALYASLLALRGAFEPPGSTDAASVATRVQANIAEAEEALEAAARSPSPEREQLLKDAFAIDSLTCALHHCAEAARLLGERAQPVQAVRSRRLSGGNGGNGRAG